MLKRTVLTVTALVATFAVATSVVATGAAAAGPPSSLTANGRYLWQFEALLNDTFHANHVSVHNLNFACTGPNCTPAAYWSSYVFTFTGARRSAFHRSTKTFRPGAFGNYPEPLRIKGKLIACDANEHHFLITYGDAVGLGLDCLTPS